VDERTEHCGGIAPVLALDFVVWSLQVKTQATVVIYVALLISLI
jgi:hypothetical protein